MRLRARRFERSDIEGYAAIQAAAWDDSMSAVREKIVSRFEIFPKGMIALSKGPELVGAASFILLDGYDERRPASWEELTDNGWCTTHDPQGKILFGVDLTIKAGAPRYSLDEIALGAGQLCVRQRCPYLIFGARIPRYHRYAEEMSPQEYVQARTKRGRYLDPELEIYSRVPGIEIGQPVVEYFKDWESMNVGVMLIWQNPAHGWPLPVLWDHSLGFGYWFLRDLRDRKRGMRNILPRPLEHDV